MALPLFASILLGTVASKVVPKFATEKLGMNPTAASLLGMAAGFGAGAAGAGVFSGGASSFGSLAGAGSSAATGLGASAPSWAPYAFRSAAAPASIMSSSSPGVMAGLQGLGYSAPAAGTLSSIVTASNGPTAWDRLKSFAQSPDQQRYLGSAASTLVEGMMQEKPKQGFISSGARGGGGGMAPAYGGGGGGGQVGVTWGFGGNKGGFVPQPIT